MYLTRYGFSTGEHELTFVNFSFIKGRNGQTRFSREDVYIFSRSAKKELLRRKVIIALDKKFISIVLGCFSFYNEFE